MGCSAADLEAIVRILAMVGKPGLSSDAMRCKRIGLANGVADLVQADVWVWSTGLIDSESGAASQTSVIIDGRWSSREEQERVTARLSAAGSTGGNFDTLLRSASVGQTLRFVQGDSEMDVKCGTSDDVCLVCGLQPGIGSMFFLSPLTFSATKFHRKLERPPFSERDKSLVDLIFSNLGWLHRLAIPSQSLPSIASFPMPERRRQVFELLLNGHTNRVIANKLAISVHTVGDHVKEINRQFKVTSRSELLAKFISS